MAVLQDESNWVDDNNLYMTCRITFPSDFGEDNQMFAGMVFGAQDPNNCEVLVARAEPNEPDSLHHYRIEDGTWIEMGHHDFVTNEWDPGGTFELDLTVLQVTVYSHPLSSWRYSGEAGSIGLVASDPNTVFDYLRARRTDYSVPVNPQWISYDTLAKLAGDPNDPNDQYLRTQPENEFMPLEMRSGFSGSDYMIEARLRSGSQGSDICGLAFRVKDRENFYCVMLDESYPKIDLYGVHDGSVYQLGTRSWTGGASNWYEMRIKCVGDNLWVWVNNGDPEEYEKISADNPWDYGYEILMGMHDEGGVGFVNGPPFQVDHADLDWLRVGIDVNDDDHLDDANDILFVNDQLNYPDASTDLSYDLAGNLVQDGLFDYVYDVFNRLVGVKFAHGNEDGNLLFAKYQYDALGRRVNKELFTSQWDPQDPMVKDLEQHYYYTGQQVAEVRNGSDLTERIFVFGTQYVDEPVFMAVNDDWDPNDPPRSCLGPLDYRWFFHQDANYNVVAVSSPYGGVVEHREYDPYGWGRIHTGQWGFTTSPDSWRVVDGSPVGNPFGFTGQFEDDESDLMYYRARHHHPQPGRFVPRDRASDATGQFARRLRRSLYRPLEIIEQTTLRDK
jgi:RHS repeat-associated protein